MKFGIDEIKAGGLIGAGISILQGWLKPAPSTLSKIASVFTDDTEPTLMGHLKYLVGAALFGVAALLAVTPLVELAKRWLQQRQNPNAAPAANANGSWFGLWNNNTPARDSVGATTTTLNQILAGSIVGTWYAGQQGHDVATTAFCAVNAGTAVLIAKAVYENSPAKETVVNTVSNAVQTAAAAIRQKLGGPR